MATARPERNDGDTALADAGITLTASHLIAFGQRYRLDAIASYGPELQPRHYRKPVVAGGAGLLCIALSFGAFEGPGTSAGLVFLGVGVLLILDSVTWALMARRNATVELVSTTGHRWRVELPDRALMPKLLEALDTATGGSGRR
jgi:hypothetical protein